MSTSTSASRQPRILSKLFISAAAAFVMATAVLLLPFQRNVEDLAVRSQQDVTRHAAQSLQLAVSTLVQREWDSLVGFSTYADVGDYRAMRTLTDAAALASEGVVWAALVGLDGIVLAGSDGVNEGTDVSTASWFNQGLRRDTVQTVRGMRGANKTSIYLSRPVRDDAGQIAGLAVYELDGSWLQAFTRDASARLGVDVAVLDQFTDVIFRYGGLMADPLSPVIRSRAELGSRFQSIVNDAKREGYVSGVLPELVTGEMPPFGWSLVVRVPLDTGHAAFGKAASSILWTIAGFFATFGITGLVFAFRYLKPLVDLAQEASRIADGETVYPSEATRTYEAEQLSNALARLQIKVHDRPINGT